jgi:hypothetical protein
MGLLQFLSTKILAMTGVLVFGNGLRKTISKY